jgi:membrane-bound lytic murein transglycosylase D
VIVPGATHAHPARGTRLSCITHPSIDAWEQRIREQRAMRNATFGGAARGAEHLDWLRQAVSDAGLPPGLALLPVVESGFRARVRARDGGVGLWQLQPATARRFGLVVSRQRDDRTHPERATRAALRYLRILHARYDDWPLALAAYNSGEGRVDRALARRPPGATFWDLAEHGHLPRITRDYVPRFLAVIRVLDEGPDCI